MKSKSRQATFTSNPIVQGFLSQNYDNLSRSSSKFTDDLFPPNDTSLYSNKPETKSAEIPEVPLFMLEDSQKKNFYLKLVSLKKKEDILGKDYQNYMI